MLCERLCRLRTVQGLLGAPAADGGWPPTARPQATQRAAESSQVGHLLRTLICRGLALTPRVSL